MSARSRRDGALLPFRDVARSMGISAATAMRLERAALAKMEAAAAERVDALPPGFNLWERCLLRAAFESYCGRLMRCPPGETPDGDPPAEP